MFTAILGITLYSCEDKCRESLTSSQYSVDVRCMFGLQEKLSISSLIVVLFNIVVYMYCQNSKHR